MANDESERLLAEIGQLLAEDTEYPLNNTLLFARVYHDAVGPSVFKELGNQILYRDLPLGLDPISSALLDLWDAQDSDDRWEHIEYVVRGGRFDVTYTYPDAIDPEEDWIEQRDRVVRRHFGDKPIVYPPWPPEDDLPDYDL